MHPQSACQRLPAVPLCLKVSVWLRQSVSVHRQYCSDTYPSESPDEGQADSLTACPVVFMGLNQIGIGIGIRIDILRIAEGHSCNHVKIRIKDIFLYKAVSL